MMSTFAVIEDAPGGVERIIGIERPAALGSPFEGQLFTHPLYGTRTVPVDQLRDGRWREVGPFGPRDKGNVAGPGQQSKAWGRRFARRLDDGRWAVIDDFFFVETDAQQSVGFSWMTHGRFHLICRDLRDVSGTEEWSHPTYEGLDSVGTPTDRDAYAMSELVVGDFGWDGQPFSVREG